MANDGAANLPVADSPSELILATSSSQPILPTDAYWRSIWAAGRTASLLNQTISTRGISGNARVVNVGGDYITHVNDGLGADTYAVLESIEDRMKVVEDKELDKEVDVWLSAPDVSQNLNAALRRRQAGTGLWFLDGAQFQKWKETPNIVLCIYGAPGCGKTVLCASIIEAVKDLCKTRRLSGWVYFFFDRRNANKGLQLYENFLRSVLSQLCSRCGGIPETVKAMYQAHGSGKEQPSIKALEEILQQLTGAFDDVYIMVDSLDESEDRIEMLIWMETVARWSSARWHLLTTSRSEPDIKSHLKRIPNICIIHLQGTTLDKDISIFVDVRLSLIGCWDELIKVLIKTTLLGGADGMFRWVAMQINSLQTCMNTREVKEKLKALPKDLGKTYERILTSSTRHRDLLQILHWLAFSARALRLEEVAEVPSVDFNAEAGPCYDPDLKYSNPSLALTVCSGLATETFGIVKLAHFSVKEYLISEHIKNGTAAQFAINERLSELVIAQTCIAYLLIFNKPDSIRTPVETTGPFPLHLYAAEYTDRHLHSAGNSPCPALQELLLDLFLPTPHSESALANWVRIYDADNSMERVDPLLRRSAGNVAPPIYYASLLGLQYIVKRLLEHGTDVNILGGRCGTALQAAAFKGHTETSKVLLEGGADANIQGGPNGTALQAAVSHGGTAFVKILLMSAAGANLRGARSLGTMLRWAVVQDDTELVKMLLEHGADANIPEGANRTALGAAAAKGRTEIVKLLIGRGANINHQGRRYGTALCAAAYEGHTETGKILLEGGADANIQGGPNGTALQAAASRGYTSIVKMLLEHGADANIPEGANRTALGAAAAQGHTEIVKLLIGRGANVNHQGRQYGTALGAAAYAGHTETDKVLLEGGADANIPAGPNGTALQVARSRRHTAFVKMLLEHGADDNIPRGRYGTVSQAAATQGRTETQQLPGNGGGVCLIRRPAQKRMRARD